MSNAHTTDEWTSHHAAPKGKRKHTSVELMHALIDLLDQKPRTGDELTAAYLDGAAVMGWPVLLDLHNVKRRLSDLHRRNIIERTGETRPTIHGSPATVWQLSVSVAGAHALLRDTQ